MFKAIGHRLALQFTLFVFLLFLVNGAVFLIADFGNAKRQAHDRLQKASHFLVDRPVGSPDDIEQVLPRNMRDRVRVIGSEGETVYAGPMFEDIPFIQGTGMMDMMIENEHYNVLTLPVLRNGRPFGFVQIADIERLQLNDLPFRAFIYLLVSVGVSALAFIAGLFFARRSLAPAEEMVVQLEQFTQDASHELRTPITVLSSSLDLSLKTQKYKEGILSAKQDLKDISTLVERLLELARLDRFTLQKSAVDFSGLVTDMADKYQLLAAEKKIALTATVAKKISVQGDAALIRQIVGNILTNAIKFTPEGGSVGMDLTKHALTITDTGIGIAEKDLPHIFDRFYQADTARTNDGFGLGLALVKRIVDLHGWTISIASKPKKGTTVTLHIHAS